MLVQPASRETVASWFSRRAARFWVDAATFCADKGTSLTAVLQNTDDALGILAEHGEKVPPEIRDWSPTLVGRGTREFREQAFPTRSLQMPVMRGCPQRLREDSEKTGEMKMRGHWLVPHVSVCVTHQTALVPLWREASPLKRCDSAPLLAGIKDDLLSGTLDGKPRKLLAFDQWIEARLAGTDFPETWLDDHPLHAASNFCHLLGAARLRLEDIPQSRVTSEDRPILYEMGFQVARHGKEAIRDTFVDLQRKPGAPHDGPKAIFPKLYDRLAYDYKDHPDYEPYRDILRDHIAATWPLGPGDELLGQPVTQRRLHSVRTAAHATGIDQRRLRKTLAAAQIVPEADKGLPDAWEVFDAAAAQSVLESVTEFITARDMANAINATRSQFDLLVEDGVLVPDLDATDVKAVWHPTQGQRFLDSLLTGAQQLRQAQHGWEHISKSAQRLKVRPIEIIDAIRDGRISRVGNRMEWEGYAAIHVYHDDVVAALQPDPIDAKSIESFARSIGMGRPSHLKRMIEAGHVQTTILKNPITKADQVYFTSDDEIVFRARFMTPKLMAEVYGAPWQRLVRPLRDAGIEPLGGREGPFGHVYLRDDTDRIVP
ncbi:TniQ family protein [Alloyangia pacifica]|uniref:TniQ family protein n=1 Tax=Alloyangia pacifica TaxID=311180 RepID=UPI001CD4F4BB|nr:TniQ family protein [Alloyangia pacifica]MCA0998120.1 TniQ family protein [Alloyangia pacifica]